MQNVIDGLLLGDSFLNYRGSTSNSLPRFGHNCKEIEFTAWIVNALSKFGLTFGPICPQPIKSTVMSLNCLIFTFTVGIRKVLRKSPLISLCRPPSLTCGIAEMADSIPTKGIFDKSLFALTLLIPLKEKTL